MKKDNMAKTFLLHIRYPYTAIIITVMWIGMAIIMTEQEGEHLEFYIVTIMLATLFIAFRGFKSFR